MNKRQPWHLAACASLALALMLSASTGTAASIDGSFAELYPDPWWSTRWGRTAITLGAAVAVAGAAAFTVASAGGGAAALSAAGSWVANAGALAGFAATYGVGAAATGLALLGTDTESSGGFGIAGSGYVIAALTGPGTGVVTDLSLDQVRHRLHRRSHQRYEFIKLPLAERRGNRDVRALLAELREIEDRLAYGDITGEMFRRETVAISDRLQRRLHDTCSDPGVQRNQLFDAINAAILAYNRGDDAGAARCIAAVTLHARQRSFLNYMTALHLLTAGAYEHAFNALDTAIVREPGALQPYILYITALGDRHEYARALEIARLGLRNVDRNSVHLLYAAGDASFRLSEYQQAAEFFQQAHRHIDDDLIRADTAMMVAVAWYRSGETSQGWDWYQRALRELGSNEEAKRAITRRWNHLVD
ncbi:MAG: tetratricopeptide repeat protein [Chromatiaceae bacterium]|nr:MAG: tetratricopeptide repeat protein [Chromatiaceae bacterium]